MGERNDYARAPDEPPRSGRGRHGQLYSSHAAADYLGIHRSTLHLAVRRQKIVPDAYTPGGHARFRQETLERFRERLSIDSATGGDGSSARALAGAVASLSHFTDLEPVCEAVVSAAMAVCPSFAASWVIACDDECPGDTGWRLLASQGLSRQVETQYRWLRRQPRAEFISGVVVRQGTPFICGDILAQGAEIPEGSRQSFTLGGFRSCVALPCSSDGATLGLLVGMGRVPCDFSEPELIALGNLAEIVAVALRRWRRDEATRRQAEAIGELMRQSQSVGPTAHGATPLTSLRAICQQGAKAKLVREWGLFATPDAEAPALLSNLLRTAAAQGATQRAEWTDADGRAVAIATPAPAAARGPAAVGAIWRRQDLRTGMEVALLQVYAQVCADLAMRGG